MGTSLTGTKIRDTYDALIKVSDNGALDGTLQVLTDGLGNNSALSLSTAGASVTGTLSVSGESTLNGAAFSDGSDLKFDLSTTSDAKIGRLDRAFIQIDRNDFAGLISFHTTPSGSSGLAERMKIYSGGDISFRDSSANEAFYWDASAASLGIGTAPSGAKLHIVASNTTAKFESSTTGLFNTYKNSNGDFAYVGTGSQTVSGGSANDFGVQAVNNFVIATGGNTERMRIDSSGNVGIGTSSLNLGGWSKALCINGAVSEALELHTNGTHFLSLAAGGSSTLLYAVANVPLIFGTNNTERMRIDSSGNVGIGGTADSSYKLHLYGSGSSEMAFEATGAGGGFFRIGAGTTASGFGGALRIYDVNAAAERMRIDSSGNVMVGTADAGISGSSTNSGVAILANGRITSTAISQSAAIFNRITSDGEIVTFRRQASQVGSISVTGSATAYNTSSDYRLKEDWVAMEGALDRVDALKPVNFAWKADGSRVDGFLAHELAEVVPEAVTGEKDATEIRSVEVSPAVYEDVIHPAEEAILDEEGNVIQEAKEEWVEKVLVSEAVYEDQEFPVYQGIDQSKIVPLLAAGLQEAHALIKELRAELNALKQA